MLEKLYDAEIILLHILLDHGFEKSGYQINIFPSNARIVEKFIGFIDEYGLQKQDITEDYVIQIKEKLKDRNLISYYANPKLNNKKVMQIDLTKLKKYQDHMQARMLYWIGIPENNKTIKEDWMNYNSGMTFETISYTGYHENIIH